MKAILTVIKALAIFLITGAVIYSVSLIMEGGNVSMPLLFQPSSGMRLLMSMEEFKFIQSENGRVSWRMSALNADLYEDKEAQLKDLEIVFSNPDNREATLLGDTGTLDTSSGNASIRRAAKDVRITTSDGYLLTTNSLFWKAGERLIWTSDPFKLLGSEIYLEGVGMTANVDMHTIAVKNNVKAILQE
jgi:LPS export ABC transporter protein LptC